METCSPCLVKTDRSARLLDWSKRPFGGYRGVTWDGEHLWAIDAARQRLCALKKSEIAPGPGWIGEYLVY